jgi:hypothetical protein
MKVAMIGLAMGSTSRAVGKTRFVSEYRFSDTAGVVKLKRPFRGWAHFFHDLVSRPLR